MLLCTPRPRTEAIGYRSRRTIHILLSGLSLSFSCNQFQVLHFAVASAHFYYMFEILISDQLHGCPVAIVLTDCPILNARSALNERSTAFQLSGRQTFES